MKSLSHILRSKGVAYALSFLFIISVSASAVYAQGGTAISGDEICGATASTTCTLKDIGTITKGVLRIIISLGLPLVVVFVAYRFVMAYFAAVQGNASAYKDALKKSANAVSGFLFLVALFGGLMVVMLKYLGVKDSPLQILNIFSLVTDPFITHAYAQGAASNPLNPLKSDSLYDVILSIVRLVMRFFIYPALIAMWVWTGFAFVMAQGAPDALNKAKKWLVGAFITSLVIFLLQAFLIAAQGTVQKILPVDTTKQTTTGGQKDTTITNGTNNNTIRAGDNAPAPGAAGSSCTLSGGQLGQIGTDGVCYSTNRGGSNTPNENYDSRSTTIKADPDPVLFDDGSAPQ